MKKNLLGFFFAMLVVICITLYFLIPSMAGDMAECGDPPDITLYTGSGNANVAVPVEQFRIRTNAWEGCKVAVVKKWQMSLDKTSQP